MKESYEVGEIVVTSWPEQYEREDHNGTIILQYRELYLVAMISKDKEGWFYAGDWRWYPESKIQKTSFDKITNLGILFSEESTHEEVIESFKNYQIEVGNIKE